MSAEPLLEPVEERVTRLYEDARDDVSAYAQTLGLPFGEAQEVAQEAFLRLYLALREGEEIHNPRGWVFRVAHNLGLKVRSRKRIFTLLSGTVEHSTAVGDTPEQRLLRRERQRRICAAVADLSPQQRHCLRLRAAGLRYREIGEAIGIATSTVNEFVRRAVARLRSAVRE